MFNLMQECWCARTVDRPTFDNICAYLQRWCAEIADRPLVKKVRGRLRANKETEGKKMSRLCMVPTTDT